MACKFLGRNMISDELFTEVKEYLPFTCFGWL